MPDKQYTKKIPYIVSHQPIGDIYHCVMPYEDVLNIAYADIRTLDPETNELDNYMGINRKISPSRVKEIAKYFCTSDATFPTSIILAISTLDENGEDNRNIITANNTVQIAHESAKILDGQHRLEGIKWAIDQQKNSLFDFAFPPAFDLNVTIFMDAGLDDQAQIFSVINKSQTKVNKSLVYDLYSYAKHRSPQKTCHDIVRILNRNEESPLYKKVKLLGTAEHPESETIAQATLVESLIKYISKDPMKDTEALRGGLPFIKKLKYPDEKEAKSLIFRKLFIDELDHIIARNLVNYFVAVSATWTYSWNNNESGNILNKSTGIIALLRFLKDIINAHSSSGECIDEVPVAYYKNVLQGAKLPDRSFTREAYQPGSSGQKDLYQALLVGLNHVV